MNHLVFIVNLRQRIISKYCGNLAESLLVNRLEINRVLGMFGNVALHTQRTVNLRKSLASRQLIRRVYGHFLFHGLIGGNNHLAGPVCELLDNGFHLHIFEVHKFHRLVWLNGLLRLANSD